MPIHDSQLTDDFAYDFKQAKPELDKLARKRMYRSRTTNMSIYLADFISAFNLAFEKAWKDTTIRSKHGIMYAINYYVKSEIVELFRQHSHIENGQRSYDQCHVVPLDDYHPITTSDYPSDTVLELQQAVKRFQLKSPHEGTIMHLLSKGYSGRQIYEEFLFEPYTATQRQQIHRIRERFYHFCKSINIQLSFTF